MLIARFILPSLAPLLLLNVAVRAQEPRPAATDRPALAHSFRETTISPDGRWVAWIEKSSANSTAAESDWALFVADLNSPELKPRKIAVSDKPCTVRSPAWSADSKRLAFLSDGDKKGQFDLYLASAALLGLGLTVLVQLLRGRVGSPPAITLAWYAAELMRTRSRRPESPPPSSSPH